MFAGTWRYQGVSLYEKPGFLAPRFFAALRMTVAAGMETRPTVQRFFATLGMTGGAGMETRPTKGMTVAAGMETRPTNGKEGI